MKSDRDGERERDRDRDRDRDLDRDRGRESESKRERESSEYIEYGKCTCCLLRSRQKEQFLGDTYPRQTRAKWRSGLLDLHLL